jgi:IS1 family transposase
MRWKLSFGLLWSFVQRKKEPQWLWHTIDHRSGKVLSNQTKVLHHLLSFTVLWQAS